MQIGKSGNNSSSHKNNVPKVSYYNTFYFLRYLPRRDMKNMEKIEYVKISLIFKKNANFEGK